MKHLDGVDMMGKSAVLAQISKPLHFFALALLIVESLIGLLSVNASSNLLQDLLYAGTGMFVLVVLMVVLLMFTKPKVLLAEKPSELVDEINELSEIQNQVIQAQQDDPRVRKIFESKINPEEKISLPSDLEKKIESLLKKEINLQKSIKKSVEDFPVNIDSIMRNAHF